VNFQNNNRVYNKVPKNGNKDLWVQVLHRLGGGGGMGSNIWTKRHVPFFHFLLLTNDEKGRRSCTFYGLGMSLFIYLFIYLN
jgi:hypothetical protein